MEPLNPSAPAAMPATGTFKKSLFIKILAVIEIVLGGLGLISVFVSGFSANTVISIIILLAGIIVFTSKKKGPYTVAKIIVIIGVIFFLIGVIFGALAVVALKGAVKAGM